MNNPIAARPESEYDPKELAMGIETEKEHSDDLLVRSITARQHLEEDPHYYSKLKVAGLNPPEVFPLESGDLQRNVEAYLREAKLPAGMDKWTGEQVSQYADKINGRKEYLEDWMYQHRAALRDSPRRFVDALMLLQKRYKMILDSLPRRVQMNGTDLREWLADPKFRAEAFPAFAEVGALLIGAQREYRLYLVPAIDYVRESIGDGSISVRPEVSIILDGMKDASLGNQTPETDLVRRLIRWEESILCANSVDDECDVDNLLRAIVDEGVVSGQWTDTHEMAAMMLGISEGESSNPPDTHPDEVGDFTLQWKGPRAHVHINGAYLGMVGIETDYVRTKNDVVKSRRTYWWFSNGTQEEGREHRLQKALDVLARKAGY